MDQVNDFIIKIKNNKYFKPIIIAAIILIAIIKFYDMVEGFYLKQKPIKPENKLDISLSNYDPRFNIDGEMMNWGGGSQAIFINCNKIPCNKFDKENIDKYEYWEVTGLTDVQFVANIVYNASAADPICVINEWGINLEKDTVTIKAGIFYFYNNIGGADAPLEGGECVITGANGYFIINIWYKGDVRIKPPQRIHYLKPGDLIPLKITIKIDEHYAGLQSTNCLNKTDALKLRLYAKLRVGGKDKIVYSKEALRIIVAEPSDTVDWNINEVDWNTMEDLRKRTIQK